MMTNATYQKGEAYASPFLITQPNFLIIIYEKRNARSHPNGLYTLTF